MIIDEIRKYNNVVSKAYSFLFLWECCLVFSLTICSNYDIALIMIPIQLGLLSPD